MTRDGQKTTCDYYFALKLIVRELSMDNYIISLRREPIRELLLLPRPNRTVNYGQWETGQSQDKYAQACHAHVHLLFDRKAWEGVKGKVMNKITLSKLNARNYPGPNYLLKDCTELEQQRLQSAEHQYMLASVTKLSVSVENSNKSFIDAISSLTIAINSLNRLVEDKDKKDKPKYSNQ
ncbi:hypothetical protein C1646_672242 [Rhizophagus diaphanus]|nr:hypothetical protein C1646_672242 [Rhizophagus diaphanus] [Rhizophagus sp. MUCL 43196]